MMHDHRTAPEHVSELLGRRPVRWAEIAGDYDGRDRTLEVFEADAGEQRGLLRALRPVRAALDAAAGGPVVIVFHTRAESRRLYASVVAAWHRKLLADLIANWSVERSDLDPSFEASDIEQLELRGAA